MTAQNGRFVAQIDADFGSLLLQSITQKMHTQKRERTLCHAYRSAVSHSPLVVTKSGQETAGHDRSRHAAGRKLHR